MKGIIYAILDDEKFYIGATTTTIEQRMASHKSLSKNPCKKKLKII
jgi:predicted GIY-YIG superfamily endonuclease